MTHNDSHVRENPLSFFVFFISILLGHQDQRLALFVPHNIPVLSFRLENERSTEEKSKKTERNRMRKLMPVSCINLFVVLFELILFMLLLFPFAIPISISCGICGIERVSRILLKLRFMMYTCASFCKNR